MAAALPPTRLSPAPWFVAAARPARLPALPPPASPLPATMEPPWLACPAGLPLMLLGLPTGSVVDVSAVRACLSSASLAVLSSPAAAFDCGDGATGGGGGAAGTAGAALGCWRGGGSNLTVSAPHCRRASLPARAEASSLAASGSLLSSEASAGAAALRCWSSLRPQAARRMPCPRFGWARLAVGGRRTTTLPSSEPASSLSSRSSTALLSAPCCCVTLPTNCRSSVTVCCLAFKAVCSLLFLRRRIATSR
mmetsp:Transcript_81909/g.231846  ORF Transcript_81909/g.231846 Transcript_81909/m.231846 type:complete len:251 (-) Transcript_81909:661-1413(-)